MTKLQEGRYYRSPIRTVTKKEIVPGVYGIILVGTEKCNREKSISIIANADADATELRSAAQTLNEIADFLDEKEIERHMDVIERKAD